MPFALFRAAVLAIMASAVLAPIGLIVYQSFLDGPFFQPNVHFSLEAFQFVLEDDDFWEALVTSIIVAGGMTAIAVPLGVVLAFLMARTDVPGKSFLEPLILVPIFMSAVVLAFGYVVALGPVGIFSTLFKDVFGVVPWSIYSVTAITIIAGLTHVPHVYLYTSAALRNLGADLEEAARTTGASPWRVAVSVSLPMVTPAVLYAAVLIFFLGFELFGLPLVLGDPKGILVLATYLYKLTNKLGVPSYQLMAVVVVAIILIAIPLVYLQRLLLASSQKYVSVRGKAAKRSPLRLGGLRWPAFALIVLWFVVSVGIPVFGIALRSVVVTWGEGVKLAEVLTLAHYRDLVDYPNAINAIVNTILIGTVGGAISVGCYTLVALAMHRWRSGWTRVADYLVMIPRSMPGLVAGLAMLWLFLFIKPLTPLRATLVSVWVAYTVVWLAYGVRLVAGTMLQIGPELEEAGRSVGATRGRVARDVTVPLARTGMLAAWLLIFLIFVREYSTGIYLLGPGTEVIGSLMVSLWGTGAIDLVSALAVINVLIISVGLGLALRLGVRLHG
ncbi:spermidine/putrescine ABC transporter permease [Alsobacter soli]|uniref:Spermidine/putrescine ABC transporter permease n=1 Tax=Alsobacter soli TaxID=2109933 RepID=A0A2T1HZ69_9HYPH|nr:iron ABC transporter permease [Alsobacter soli]PSC06878.1 spermidine/putrescine ABC transporter permease [Alsobacter soli]